MKNSDAHFFRILVVALIFASCGGGNSTGGAEAGNPPSAGIRAVTGTLPQSSIAETCPADAVVATNSRAEATMADVESDCSFSLNLATGKAYTLGFVLGDEFIASMIFNNGSGMSGSMVMMVSEGDNPIELGLITFTNGNAFPGNEPSRQNDRDEDGRNDFEDEDDDDDDIADDEDNEDCDMDGFSDDMDEDRSFCEEEGSEGEDGNGNGNGNNEEDEDESTNDEDEEDEGNDT